MFANRFNGTLYQMTNVIALDKKAHLYFIPKDKDKSEAFRYEVKFSVSGVN